SALGRERTSDMPKATHTPPHPHPDPDAAHTPAPLPSPARHLPPSLPNSWHTRRLKPLAMARSRTTTKMQELAHSAPGGSGSRPSFGWYGTPGRSSRPHVPTP